jgi:phosphate:Na+ symporter
LINIVGAVALLLWGLRMVRTGVSRAFGTDLRHLISRGVANRFSALLVGIGVTGILQSSTATALMVASFASRGLVATAPALAVMLGADIGTTLVAQVLAFDVAWLSPIFIAVGLFAHNASEATRIRQIGRATIGIGLMLLALYLIVSASEPLRDSALLQRVFGSLVGEQVIAVLIAALLTWLAHSSLAVVLLVMSLAAAGVVPLPFAFALVLGANLGGIVPPIMATLGQEPEARRVPLGNALFKIVGCLAVLPLIDALAPTIAYLGADPARQVVNFHTAFNLAVATVFLFATEPIANLSRRLLPSQAKADDPGRPKHLDRDNIQNPQVALACAARETLRMGDIVETMLRKSITVIRTDEPRLADEVITMDDAVDRLHEQIKLYVAEASREPMDQEESLRASEILTFTTNLEHIGDIVENLMQMAAKKIKNKMRFSEDGLEEITAIHEKVVENLKLALGVFMSSDVKLARQLLAEKKKVIALERAGAESHMARLRQGRPESIETSALHMDFLRDLKRIHSHIVAVAYPVLDRAGELERLKREGRTQAAENGNGSIVLKPKGATPAT